jgi:hypothetical protein
MITWHFCVSRMIRFFFNVVRALAVGVLALIGISTNAPVAFAQTPSVPSKTVAVYDGVVDVDPMHARVRGQWTLQIERTVGVDSLVLLLNRALVVREVGGADVRTHTLGTTGDLGRIVVHLAPTARVGVTTLHLSYEGKPEMSSDGINALSAEWVELGLDSFWHPVIAGFAHEIMGQVKLVLPSTYRVTASGAITRRGDTTLVMNRPGVLDFAFAASPTLAVRATPRARVHAPATVEGDMPANTDVVLRTASDCAELLQQQFGAKTPLPPMDVVLPPRKGAGYARRGYVVIAVGSDTSTLGRTNYICHELAHFWSLGAISSGPDNWLNEGFAEYVAGRSVRSLLGAESYQRMVARWQRSAAGQGPIWVAGSTARPSERISYSKAPLLLDTFESRIGVATMDRLLLRFLTDPSVRTTPLLLALVDEVTGPEQGAWFRDQLGR